MKYYVVCDYRENLINHSQNYDDIYNDHPAKRNINEIIAAVKSLGYQCEYFGGIPELIHAIDYHQTFENSLFLNFTDGMDQNYSRVQAPVLFDILKVPYSGSDVFASVLMNNKHFCKQALANHNITMPKSCIINPLIPLDVKELRGWNYPLFVKPNCEGSSLGISKESVCHTIEEVIIRVNELLKSFDELLIEEYVYGTDITNYLIGNDKTYYINDIVMAELSDKSPYAVYGANEKHHKQRTLFYNEEKIPTKTIEKIQNQSLEIAKIIGARDVCRIDYRLDVATQEISFIEINSAPRFSSTSEIGFIASKRNITFAQMVKYYLLAFSNRICNS